MVKVLIVDDNASIVKVATLVLERHGYNVASADDEGLFQLAEEWQPSVVLMDVRLPKIDGIEACVRLKRNPATSGVPVIFLTADLSAQELVAEAGADDILLKPFSNADLIEMIERFASQRGGVATGLPKLG